jgi:hypothetical protein
VSTTKKAKAAAKTRTSKTARKGVKRTAKAAKKATAKKRATARKKATTAAKSPRAGADTATARRKTTAKATTAAKPVAAKRTAAKKATAKAATRKKRTSKAKATPGRDQARAAGGRPRRAIYIDVENTSSRATLLSVIDSLGIDRRAASVELFAVGNWRAVGQQVARELAGLGAQLVHSAPARGVRDWSDLWIAVAAGSWIALAEPGDKLEIISNDRAFDAVGDAAAARGVLYERVPHRRSASTATTAEPAAEDKPKRRRRRRPRRSGESAESTEATEHKKAASSPPEEDAHGASRDQMVELLERLSEGRSSPWVNLDVLEAALKREGFSRPPNSPRLVTRLRRLKDFEVDSHGRVRLLRDGETPSDDSGD